MRQHLINLAQALWVGGAYFAIGYFAAGVYWPQGVAVTVGMILGVGVILVYLGLILTGLVEIGSLPWTIIFIGLPFVGVVGVVLQFVTRWLAERLGLLP